MLRARYGSHSQPLRAGSRRCRRRNCSRECQPIVEKQLRRATAQGRHQLPSQQGGAAGERSARAHGPSLPRGPGGDGFRAGAGRPSAPAPPASLRRPAGPGWPHWLRRQQRRQWNACRGPAAGTPAAILSDVNGDCELGALQRASTTGASPPPARSRHDDLSVTLAGVRRAGGARSTIPPGWGRSPPHHHLSAADRHCLRTVPPGRPHTRRAWARDSEAARLPAHPGRRVSGPLPSPDKRCQVQTSESAVSTGTSGRPGGSTALSRSERPLALALP